MDKERIIRELALDDPATTTETISSVFNQHFAVVLAGPKCVVLDKNPTAGEGLAPPAYALIEQDQMQRIFMPQKVVIPRAGRAPLVRTVFQVWWEHEWREEYMGGLILDPALAPAGQPDRTWNIWPGLPFPETVKTSPRPTGSWRKLRQHMLDNICDRNRSLYKFLLRYMARLIQHPEWRAEVSLVLRSDEEGVGKGRLIWSLARLLPAQHVGYFTSAEDLFGRFNKKLATSVLAILDEATFAGDKRQVGQLQTMITEPRIGVDEKYEPRIELENRLHLILSTNQAWAVSASRTARRYAVFKVAPHQLRNRPYFEAIEVELCTNEDSGYRRMKHDLLNIDLTGWDHTRIPESVGLAEQRELSLAVHEQWWADCLTRGRIEFHATFYSIEEFGVASWPEWLSTDRLFASYSHFNRRRPRPDQHPLERNMFGRWLKGVLKLQQYRPGATAQDRSHGYRLGTLEYQRHAFDERHRTALFSNEENLLA